MAKIKAETLINGPYAAANRCAQGGRQLLRPPYCLFSKGSLESVRPGGQTLTVVSVLAQLI